MAKKRKTPNYPKRSQAVGRGPNKYLECHKGNIQVFSQDKISVFGGGKVRDCEPIYGGIIVDCGNVFNTERIRSTIQLPKSLLDTMGMGYDVVQLDWRDGSAPIYPTKFWHELVSFLRKEGRDVLVCCAGGHGRTGTALAVLADIFGVVPSNTDPVAYIRNRYCEYAVETRDQIDYVEEITKREVIEKPHSFGHWGYAPY